MKDQKSSLRSILMLAFVVGSSVQAQTARPPVRILAPATAGGGWDNTAHAVAETLKKEGLRGVSEVYNVPGKAGTLGLAEFVKLRGQANQLMMTGFVMVAGIPLNNSPYDLTTDVTPIARLTTDYEVFVVPAKSPYRDVEDLMESFKANPRSIRFGGSSAGGSGHIAVSRLAQELKIPTSQIQYIPSAGGSQATKAMLGGELDVVSAGYSELEDFIKSGQVRGLAISAPEAVDGINLPTFVEKGLDVDVSNWRGIVAPAGISTAERNQLTLLMTKMVRTRTWQQQLTQNKWNPYFASGDTFGRFLRTQRSYVAQLLKDLNIKN
ncbi:tripartite tricarboxylate transporter substrate binding protein [Deinococcus sp. QL22]|uniref:Bug family tripartite tricarboxylate transporter substrate binding protein n=1 Tax=Deinococcus sp. QL22 TaxID=2939437 RepID=UPI002017A8F2|nr:tripartite tricarboxylate transporter substrate binding protein [Deinococcus sp. QL22]UQN09244.1 tripartite tricarboxylate transporter substrate binding protein [Deinococcus sp. QL22]